MWVTAFDEVAEVIMGVTVKKFNAFDYDGRKRVAWGLCGIKCYMTIEKAQGVYTNYTFKSMLSQHAQSTHSIDVSQDT